jgi:hypothetical protein
MLWAQGSTVFCIRTAARSPSTAGSSPRSTPSWPHGRELIGLIKVVRHWHPYLWARPFVVRTDHFALKYLLDQHLSTIRQHTWVSKLFGYDFHVVYLPGKANPVVDALSHRDEHTVMALPLSSPSFVMYDELRQELQQLQEARHIIEKIEKGEAIAGWSVMDGLIIHAGRIFVPAASTLWPAILDTAHETGHKGVQKTLHRLRSSFYSPKATQWVKDFVKSCVVCQCNKSEHMHPAGLLQPLEVPSSIWANIAIDFVEGFPHVDSKTVVLMVVDHFSKYVHFIPLGHLYTAVSVAKAFFNNIIKLHGIPCSIVSDRDPVFTSTFWKELFHLTGVQLRMSTAFHPQTDGQSEVTNRILGVYLRYLAWDEPRSWLRWLPWVEYCYNTSFQTALCTTPFEVVYGHEPPALLSHEKG